jgi:ketosteroid isomerase-like protein
MKKWILFVFTAILLSAANPDSKTEKEVLATLDVYKQALLKRDAAALSKVLSDDLTYTHSSNLHQDKAAVLESLKGTSFQEAIEYKDLKVRQYGNTAVVTGDVDFRNNTAGVVAISKLYITFVLVKGPQGWQIVDRQATKYPDPAPAPKK